MSISPRGGAAVVGQLNETRIAESNGNAKRQTREVACSIPKRTFSDLLGVEIDPEGSVIASCIRDVCLRVGMVSSITGLSVPTIYREIAQDRFPRPIKISAGARAWKLSEIMDWIETRERDSGPTIGASSARG
jgi:prophage regulatory protein